MSIAMGFIGEDGILLATDSRLMVETKYEIFSDETSQKLWKINTNIGATSIGSEEEYRKYLIGKLIQVSSKARKNDDFEHNYLRFIDIIKKDYQKRIKGFTSESYKLYVMYMMIAGYDKDGIATIIKVESSTRSGLPFAPNKVTSNYCIHNSGTIAEYWISKLALRDKLKSGLTIDRLKKIAVFLISESYFGIFIGGKIQMATITKDAGFKFVEDSVIKQITDDAHTFAVGMTEDIIKWLNKA